MKTWRILFGFLVFLCFYFFFRVEKSSAFLNVEEEKLLNIQVVEDKIRFRKKKEKFLKNVH